MNELEQLHGDGRLRKDTIYFQARENDGLDQEGNSREEQKFE